MLLIPYLIPPRDDRENADTTPKPKAFSLPSKKVDSIAKNIDSIPMTVYFERGRKLIAAQVVYVVVFGIYRTLLLVSHHNRRIIGR